jgi:replicative DNA helicase
MPNQDYRSLVHTPADLAVEFVEYAKTRKRYNGVTWGVPSMDSVIIPMHPGDITGIIARPGHGKSTLCAYLARHTGKRIMESDDKNRAVVYVTFEQSVEEIEAMFEIDAASELSITDIAWGKADIDQLVRQSVKRPALPVAMIGKSQSRRKVTPRMTIENVYKALRSFEDDYKTRIELIILDYIQIIPVEGARDRTTQVGEAINASKELAIDCGCPIVIAVQAKADVDKYDLKIPGAGDTQWASAIGQVCDKEIGMWRPVLTEQDGAVIDIGSKEIKVTQNLMVARISKQRMAPAGYTFILNFAPEYVRLADMELRHADLNG